PGSYTRTGHLSSNRHQVKLARSPLQHWRYDKLRAAQPDSSDASDIVIENQTVVTSVIIGTNNPLDIGYVNVHDIYFRNNSWRVDPLLTISSSSYLHARNIVCTDNHQWGTGFTDDDYSRGVELGAYSVADIDSLCFLRNRATVARCAGATISAPSCLVQHVTVEDCLIGDSTYVGEQAFNIFNALFMIRPGELRHSTFRRNRFIYAPNPSDPDPTSTFHQVLLLQKVGEGSPGNAMVDCVFEDNDVIDLRDYSTITRPIEGVQGWGIRVESYNRRSYHLQNCVFRNNRYRNLNPEYPWRENSTDTYWVDTNIGSFLYFDLELYDNSTFSIQNCLFEGNDEGGVSVGHHPVDGGSDNFVVENTVFRNLSRRALYFRGIRSRITNCLFDGIHSNLPTTFESEQVAFAANTGDTTYVRNSVFMNCNLPGLVLPGASWFDWGEYGESGRIVFDGCLFWNNTVDQFEAEPSGWYLLPDAPIDLLPLPGVYRHSLLPEPMALQSNCLVDVDPQFDPLLGAPFLSVASPCVDAGNPGPEFEDPEDPAVPGRALFPALGTRRNDMGLFGGPLAVQTDTAWVALPAWTAQARPTGFHLGAPWPNPFNPVTRIPLTLARPIPVRLSVHNLLGQEVTVLANGILPAGTHLFPFQGKHVASGLYVVQLEAGGRTESRVITLLR
ncbi:MAG: right-handed parallel beta-helix repeat-containing protein, partial [Candidatus Delongbacteria bacterium]